MNAETIAQFLLVLAGAATLSISLIRLVVIAVNVWLDWKGDK